MRRRTKDPKDRQGYNLGARYLVFLVITLGMFAYLLTGVFRLQVVESETYVDSAESSPHHHHHAARQPRHDYRRGRGHSGP